MKIHSKIKNRLTSKDLDHWIAFNKIFYIITLILHNLLFVPAVAVSQGSDLAPRLIEYVQRITILTTNTQESDALFEFDTARIFIFTLTLTLICFVVDNLLNTLKKKT